MTRASAPTVQPWLAGELRRRYDRVRQATERLCTPLSVEDYVVQCMPDVSPAKWHLGHTSWFFETFVIRRYLTGYRQLDERYPVLFNSYYNGVGPQWPRGSRGLLSRPSVRDVYVYRAHVDRHMAMVIENGVDEPELARLIELGLNHEQQHQELLLTDIKYNLGFNPLRPAYQTAGPIDVGSPASLAWAELAGGLVRIGHVGPHFAFDNEVPQHSVFVAPYRLGSRLVTNGEYLEFVEAGGYRDPRWWLSDGWNAVSSGPWTAPLYWERIDEDWWTYTMGGPVRVNEHAPVTHVSYYEADAFARWSGHRLPTEQEWEHAARDVPIRGNLLDGSPRDPCPAPNGAAGLEQLFGDVWEWTQSSYCPYPGFRPEAGAIAEYNGKFMVNQQVLRGGSCATPVTHIRMTYRNFFPPDARWQFTGIRLAEDVTTS